MFYQTSSVIITSDPRKFFVLQHKDDSRQMRYNSITSFGKYISEHVVSGKE